MGFVEEPTELAQRAVRRVDAAVVGDVVTLVAHRRGIEGEQPDRGDAEILQVVEVLREADEVADAVAVAVGEGAHVQLVDDGVLVPGAHAGAPADRGRTENTCAGTVAGSSSTKLRAPCHE